MSETQGGSGETVLAWLERRTSLARRREVESDDPKLEYRRRLAAWEFCPEGGQGALGRRCDVWLTRRGVRAPWGLGAIDAIGHTWLGSVMERGTR